MKVSELIKKYRKAAGLTQEELAKKINCATITIRQYESGKRDPSVSTLLAIADALNVDFLDLIDAAEKQKNRDNTYLAIKALIERIKKAEARTEKAEKERDKAISDIRHECKTCLYHHVYFNGCTPDHECKNMDGGCSNNYDRWVWRGIKEEERCKK